MRRIIQLPDKIFPKTEARTHIIFINKSDPVSDNCELFSSNSLGVLSKKIITTKKLLIERMDYKFYKTNICNTNTDYITLKDIGGIIKRGKFSYKELRESNLPFFHSIHFKENATNICFSKPIEKIYHSNTAKKGDILMCRVGKRIVGKVAIVKSGRIINSDCIYKISVPLSYRQILLKSLLSEQGKAWLNAYAHGVCSQVISKSDLENFPLFNLKS